MKNKGDMTLLKSILTLTKKLKQMKCLIKIKKKDYKEAQ
jgi:hypothetical protein